MTEGPHICEQEEEEVKFIRSEYFSNRKYRISVDLYEHEMAVAHIVYKSTQWIKGSWYICFDECKRESVFDLVDCLTYLKKRKPPNDGSFAR